MIVVVTGMVGLDKKSYLVKACRLAEDMGHQVTLCNVGDMMYSEAADIGRGKILDIPLKRLHQLRRSVFKDIIAKKTHVDHLIINTHATFRWRHGLFPAVDFDQMRQLDADVYINLIDGIAVLHSRLIQEHTVEHTLKDLIVWREEELICTEMLRNGIDENKPVYCLARGAESETIQTFYKLVFEGEVKKAYLSFPMTHVSDIPRLQGQIDDFRVEMKKLFTCFDPADLEESYLPQKARAAMEKGLEHIQNTDSQDNSQLNPEQVLQIETDINSQIYARDFLLIDQSDMIISFIPTLEDGRASISSGVERELQHAHEAAKEVFVIWPSAKPPSVFVTQTASRVFTSVEQAKEYLVTKGYCKY
jgi:adenylate kinase